MSVLDAAAGGRPVSPPSPPSPVLALVPEDDPLDLAVDARGGRIYVANSQRVDALDARTGRVLHTARGTAVPLAMAVDGASGQLAALETANPDDSRARAGVAFLSLRTGALTRTTAIRPFDTGAPVGLAADPRAGRVFAVVSDADATGGHVYALDARSGRLVRVTPVGPFPVAAVDGRAGRLFVVCYGQDAAPGTVWVLDARSGLVVRTIPLHTTEPEPPVVDERTGRAFVADDGALLVLDARSGAVIRRITADNPENVTLDGRTGRVFVGNLRGSGTVSMVDGTSGAVVRTVPVGGDIGGHTTLRVDDATGQMLAYVAGDDAVVLDGRTGLVSHTVPLPGDIVGVSPRTGHWLVAIQGLAPSMTTVDTGPGHLVALDPRDGKVLRTVSLGGDAAALPIASDARTGRVFVADRANGTVTILDAARL